MESRRFVFFVAQVVVEHLYYQFNLLEVTNHSQFLLAYSNNLLAHSNVIGFLRVGCPRGGGVPSLNWSQPRERWPRAAVFLSRVGGHGDLEKKALTRWPWAHGLSLTPKNWIEGSHNPPLMVCFFLGGEELFSQTGKKTPRRHLFQ